MNEETTFSLSYEQMTELTGRYISMYMVKAAKASGPDADTEMDWARATLDHWYLLAQAGRAPETQVDADRLRLLGIIWGTPTAEERACE